MKRVLLIMSVVLTAGLGAVDTGLLKQVPAKYEMAVLADVEKLLKLPAAKSVLEDEAVSGAASELSNAGVSLSDIKAVLGFYSGDAVGAVIKVANSGKIRELLDSSPAKDGLYVEAMALNGRRIYRFNATGRSERPVCMFIAGDLILAADSVENLEKILAAAKLSADEAKRLASGIPAGVALWGAWRNPEPVPQPEDKAAAERVDAVRATLDFTGRELRDLDATADILCGSANFAAMLGMMIPGYLSIGSGVVFADAPELGEELIKGFKSTPEGKALKLRLHMSEKLVRHIVEFSTRMAKDQAAAAVRPADNTPKAQAGQTSGTPAEKAPRTPAGK